MPETLHRHVAAFGERETRSLRPQDYDESLRCSPSARSASLGCCIAYQPPGVKLLVCESLIQEVVLPSPVVPPLKLWQTSRRNVADIDFARCVASSTECACPCEWFRLC